MFIALSNSGESEELLQIVPLLKRQGAKLIALTGKPRSALAREADVHLYAGAAKEACPLNLAPTASTTAALALGDALAVALIDARGFTADDFARSHPGGALGQAPAHARARRHAQRRRTCPRCPSGASVMEAMLEMTRGRMGMTAVLDDAQRVIGIFTDGDLRRTLEKGARLRRARASTERHDAPARARSARALAVEAVEIMERHKVNQMLVVDERGALVGALNMHDLFRAKVI